MGNLFNKAKTTLLSYKNDGTDPRKNDLWRILMFACNSGASIALMSLVGKWSYYTQNVLELGIFLATVLVPMRLLDAITDPLIASTFDNFQTKPNKMGKYRIFMLVGGLSSILPAIIIFFYPINIVNAIDFSFLGSLNDKIDVSFWVTALILATAYAILTIGNTILNTAIRAGQAVITQDPKQRPLYGLGKTVVDAIVMAFISIVITSGLIGDMQNQYVWKIATGILSVVSLLLIFAGMKAIDNRDNPTYYALSSNAGKTNIGEFFSLIKRSKPMKSLIIAVASDSIAASVRASLAIYLFASVILNYSLNSIFEILNGVVFGVPVLLVGMYIATKKGSTIVYSKISLIQTILSASGFVLSVIFLRGDESSVYTGLTVPIVLVMFVFGMYISSLGVSSNLVNSMTGDLSDYEYTQSGKYIPGTIGATLTFVTKCITSVVSLITTGMMWFCFHDTSYVIVNNEYQNDRFFYCVLIGIFLFPAAGHLITYIAMLSYPLTEEKMEEVSQLVVEARAQMEKEKAELLEEVLKKVQEEKETVSADSDK